MTLGLADVSARVGLRSVSEAEKYIRDMVRWGGCGCDAICVMVCDGMCMMCCVLVARNL